MGSAVIKLDAKKYTQFEHLLFLTSRLTREAIQSRTLPEFWPVLAEGLVSLFGCDRASLYFLKDGLLQTEFAMGLKEPVKLKLGQGIAGWVAEKDQTYLVNDPSDDPLFDPTVDKRTGYKTKNILATPFRHEGSLVGVVELFNKKGGFSRADARALEWLSPHVGFILRMMELDEEKRRLESRVEQNSKMAELGFLVSGVAHDLGHPLTLMMTRVELLLSKAVDSPHRADLEKLLQDGESCKTILQNLLNFARKAEFKLEPVPLEEILQETLDIVAYQARLNKVNLRPEIARRLPHPFAARNQLQQVFLNLFINALQAMPRGGTLHVQAQPNDRDVFIRVRDTGEGISPEDLPRVFEPFFTTRKEGGTGLGLAICRDIVLKCGGSMDAQSDGPGKGALFTVRLPTVLPAANPGQP